MVETKEEKQDTQHQAWKESYSLVQNIYRAYLVIETVFVYHNAANG